MKIIFLGAYSDADITLAPIKVGRELFNNFVSMGMAAVYLCYYDDGSKYDRIQKLFGFEKVKERIFRSGIFPLLSFVIKYKPDVIQIINADAFYLPVFFLKPIFKFKIAYLSHSIISYSIKNYLQISCYHKLRFRLIEWIVLKHSDILEVLSNAEARFFTRFLKVKNEKIKIVDNGINLFGIKKEYLGKPKEIKIIFVGSINRKEKSFDFLLRALSELKNKIVLNVFNYETQSKGNLEIPANVQLFIGEPLKEVDLRKEFCKNDLLVVCSSHESFGLSLLEGMDTGILFIASDRVGLTERFPESLKRFVIQYGSVEKLKDKILELHYMDDSKKNELGESIRNFSSQFSWDKVSSMYLINFRKIFLNYKK